MKYQVLIAFVAVNSWATASDFWESPHTIQKIICRRPHEEYNQCSGRCQSSCFDALPLCDRSCSAGCVCVPGYTRLQKDDGHKAPCIPKTLCEEIAQYLKVASNKMPDHLSENASSSEEA